MLVGNSPPDIDTLLDVFWSAWHEHGTQKVLFAKGEDVNSVGHLAERMFRAFQGTSFARPSGTILGVEEELRGQLLPGLPDLLARVDLLIDEPDALVVTDFKTARSAWGEEHVTDAASQLLLYHELAKPLADGKPVRLRFAVLTKSKFPELEVHEVPVDPHRVQRTKHIVKLVWQAIQSGFYFPNPSPINCPSCPYRQPCRDWKG